MRSSTSASEALSPLTAIVLLLAALALWFCLLEVLMRTLVPHMSAGRQREQSDYRHALALRPVAPVAAPSVLLVGNSLLLNGVDRPTLQRSLAPRYAVSLFPVEGTQFFDWYFGLRRYFGEGARPAVVVLCMNVRQLISNGTNGPGFARLMMRPDDLLRVKRASELNRMQTSDYFFANLSAWFGLRDGFRNAVMEKLLPGAEALVMHFTQPDPLPLNADDATVDRALQRLRQMNGLVAEHGARFVMLIPPTLRKDDPGPQLARAAAREGIPVVIPYAPGAMSPADFSDGFHLDPQGAALFTARLAEDLPSVLRAQLSSEGRAALP